MNAMKRPESVLVVIYTKGGDVLMLERCAPQDFWQSVTGSLEWGETAALAAQRELKEETGLSDVLVIDMQHQQDFPILPAWQHRYETGVIENTEHWFRLELAERCTVSLSQPEHRQYRWLPWRDAAQLATSWTNRDAILRIFEENNNVPV